MIKVVIYQVEWEVVNIKTLCEIIGTYFTFSIGIELMELIMPQGLLYLVSECEIIFGKNLFLTIENSDTHHFVCCSEILFLPFKHVVLLSELSFLSVVSQIIGHLLKGHFSTSLLEIGFDDLRWGLNNQYEEEKLGERDQSILIYICNSQQFINLF